MGWRRLRIDAPPLGDRGRGLGLSVGLDDQVAMTHRTAIDA